MQDVTSTKETVLSLDSFGIGPGTGENAVPAFQRLLDALPKDSSPVRIVFPPGRYDFFEEGAFEKTCFISNHFQEKSRRVAILLENLHNVTIDGKGSSFYFHGGILPVAVIGCSGCSLENFSVDFAFPTLHAFSVLKNDSAGKHIVCKSSSGEKFEVGADGKSLIFTDEGHASDRMFQALVFDENGHPAWNLPGVPLNYEQAAVTGPGIVEFTGWKIPVRPHEHLVFRSAARPAPGIFIDRSLNSSIREVKIYFAFGIGVLAQFSENIFLSGLAVCPGRENGIPRCFSTQADATHFSCCRGRIVSENGFYEAMSDDAINVHGIYLRIRRVIDQRTVEASFMTSHTWGFQWGEPGDRLTLVEAGSLRTIRGNVRIHSILPIGGEELRSFLIQFETEIRELHSLPVESLALDNLSNVPDEVIFRRNTVRNNIARGALFSTSGRIVCEDNFFDHVQGPAILIAGDCSQWFESGPCRSVLIRNNRFRNPLLAASHRYPNAAVTILPETGENSRGGFYHSGIQIRNNFFDLFDKPVLYAKSVKDLLFDGNRIQFNRDFKPHNPNGFAFHFEHVGNISFKNNTVSEPLSPHDFRIIPEDKNSSARNFLSCGMFNAMIK